MGNLRGRTEEQRARRWLERAGLVLVTSNYRCRLGELDLVMADGDTLVVVEVRARRSSAWGSAEESVSRHKQRRLLAATRHFLSRYAEWRDAPVRFDVVAMQPGGGDDTLRWIKDAFAADD